jgi:hypothetical protein
VPPLKIKPGLICVKKKHHKRHKRGVTPVALKEEDVFYKRVVPPIKLILGQAKKAEILKPKPSVRNLVIVLNRVDQDPAIRSTANKAEEGKGPPVSEQKLAQAKKLKPMPKSRLEAETAKRKLSDDTKAPNKKLARTVHQESSDLELPMPKAAKINKGPCAEEKVSKISPDRSKAIGRSVEKSSSKASVSEARPRQAEAKGSVETSGRRRSRSGKVAHEEAARSGRPGEPSPSRLRHPSAAAKLETPIEAMYRPRKEILQKFADKNRRPSLPELSAGGGSALTTAKPLLVTNPPFFARKSVPRPVDLIDDKVVEPPQPAEDLRRAEESGRSTTADKQSPTSTVKAAAPKPSGPAEPGVSVRSAIHRIRQTPDTAKVYNMIDELFDNVMDTYKSDKTEADFVCDLIVEQLIDSVLSIDRGTPEQIRVLDTCLNPEPVIVEQADRKDEQTTDGDVVARETEEEGKGQDQDPAAAQESIVAMTECQRPASVEADSGPDVVTEACDPTPDITAVAEPTHARSTRRRSSAASQASHDDGQLPVKRRSSHDSQASHGSLDSHEGEPPAKHRSTRSMSFRADDSHDGRVSLPSHDGRVSLPSHDGQDGQASHDSQVNLDSQLSHDSDPPAKRRSTRSTSSRTDDRHDSLVEAILDDVIGDAVLLSEMSVRQREDSWALIVATARPAPEMAVSSPEMRMSSEVETDDDSSIFVGGRDLSLASCLPYQVDF